ncbi:hypothetical protein [Legionella jordanis]|uniref:DUF4189 domain-containing protein n=1 Tax=Legionella jordanis TaxID=456 RepID=A0A0W0V890_9GAMM|nr:hypothetical protein [Legionella jordanis]KTD16353.1 hypothetical protein Ljor_0659 [Legionella jordanis]RMX04435.1 hypothetical protein EAW55_03095 [Legionella jordanis]RMX20981.1 hypothetical protein EAS68_04550 [Legionella jordanis]VEH12188.1 Uncharacterised protein [Legionella jordanis]HAT8713400.1 hypothetical protein [Legionella jordanis]
MKIKAIAGVVATLSLLSFSVHANWVCNVANKRGQHWTFTAPDEAGAQSMAKNACDANSINPSNCNPNCYDNGVAAGRWHCVVSNKKGQHWSFFAPTQAQATSLAKNACDANSINPNNCNPSCVPE